MSITSVLRAGKLMATKPVVFITGLLALSIMANAYSLDEKLGIYDGIPPGNPHYSKNGFTLKPSGHGYCMYGVYNPASCTSAYETKYCQVRIHFAASFEHGCILRHKSQDFNIINNDTGKIVASFQWYKSDVYPKIKKLKDPEHIVADVMYYYKTVENKLNIF
ncbi:hypothetical protein [Candidatus Sororendozoicomonas aggregata]|uniref:hypothetical protein n=1 Tax=Candidatus Sororendozoicomonas aggregata TaxID=3073239 RepID=UPI002ED2C919